MPNRQNQRATKPANASDRVGSMVAHYKQTLSHRSDMSAAQKKKALQRYRESLENGTKQG